MIKKFYRIKASGNAGFISLYCEKKDLHSICAGFLRLGLKINVFGFYAPFFIYKLLKTNLWQE
jgi:hypothetical protein